MSLFLSKGESVFLIVLKALIKLKCQVPLLSGHQFCSREGSSETKHKYCFLNAAKHPNYKSSTGPCQIAYEFKSTVSLSAEIIQNFDKETKST